jgi:hypothetical protein
MWITLWRRHFLAVTRCIKRTRRKRQLMGCRYAKNNWQEARLASSLQNFIEPIGRGFLYPKKLSERDIKSHHNGESDNRSPGG